MIITELRKQGLISPPKFLDENTAYLCRMGSEAYGAAIGGVSDADIYGFAIPHKEDAFPHLAGFISGFGSTPNPFQQWSEQHIKSKDGRHEYDFTVYSIIKFFHMAYDASPNIVDALFVPRRCIIHTTSIGNVVRENRKLFLSRKLKHRLMGYAFAQLSKLKNAVTPFVTFVREHEIDARVFADEKGTEIDEYYLSSLSESDKVQFYELFNQFPIKQSARRRADILKVGYSTKEAYHIVRLALQCEQVLAEGDLDLERNSQVLLSIRRGEWSFERLNSWFETKEKSLEGLYATSVLPHSPDEAAIKQLLVDCLEMHYGSISTAIARDSSIEMVLRDMKEVMERYS